MLKCIENIARPKKTTAILHLRECLHLHSCEGASGEENLMRISQHEYLFREPRDLYFVFYLIILHHFNVISNL